MFKKKKGLKKMNKKKLTGSILIALGLALALNSEKGFIQIQSGDIAKAIDEKEENKLEKATIYIDGEKYKSYNLSENEILKNRIKEKSLKVYDDIDGETLFFIKAESTSVDVSGVKKTEYTLQYTKDFKKFVDILKADDENIDKYLQYTTTVDKQKEFLDNYMIKTAFSFGAVALGEIYQDVNGNIQKVNITDLKSGQIDKYLEFKNDKGKTVVLKDVVVERNGRDGKIVLKYEDNEEAVSTIKNNPISKYNLIKDYIKNGTVDKIVNGEKKEDKKTTKDTSVDNTKKDKKPLPKTSAVK
jgi:hypothetical protein